MTDKYNLVSGTIPPELIKEIVDSVTRWRAAMPFLVAFTAEERKEAVHPGDQGLAASVAMAETAAAHPGHFPASIGDPAELKRDAQLASDMAVVAAPLASLLQAVQDTEIAARSDAYRTGLRLYGVAKLLRPTSRAWKRPSLRCVSGLIELSVGRLLSRRADAPWRATSRTSIGVAHVGDVAHVDR